MEDPPRGLPIGAVSQAAGIPASTLRTWERRYGFPRPVRGPGGQRVYPPEVVPHLAMVVRAIDSGHRPAQLLQLGAEDLQALLAGKRARRSSEDHRVDPRWAAATRALDGPTLHALWAGAWDRLGGLRFLDERVIPYLRAVGRAWAAGNLEVYQERFATHRLQSFLAGRWHRLAEANQGPWAVAAVLPGEQHELPLHLVAVALAIAGWRPVVLGQAPPLEVAACARALSASAAAVAVSGTADAVAARAELVALRGHLQPGVHLVIGGSGAPPRLPGTGFFEDVAALAAWAEAMA